MNHLKFYNYFSKGIRFTVATVHVSFTLKLPKYLNFIDHSSDEYMGWELYMYKDHQQHRPMWFLRVSKDLPITKAFIEAIWFRNQLNKAFKLFNPYPRPRPRSLKSKMTNDWVSDILSELNKEEHEYVLRSHTFKNKNQLVGTNSGDLTL